MEIIITDKQMEYLVRYMPNLKELLQGDLNDFLIELDDIIIGELGDDYETTEISAKLQKIYDEILDQN